MPVEVDLSWLVIFGLLTFALATESMPVLLPYVPPITQWAFAVLASVSLFVCILLHELAHCTVARWYHLPVSGITLFFFGGVAHLEGDPDSPKAEMVLAASGPMMSFALGGVLWLLGLSMNEFQFTTGLAEGSFRLSVVNLALGAFNLVPGLPLDGGRILRAALWVASRNLRLATRMAAFLGRAFGVFLMAVGGRMIWRTHRVEGLWFVVIGWVLFAAAQGSYRSLLLQLNLRGLHAAEAVVSSVRSVPSLLSVREFADVYLLKGGAAFPVVEGDHVTGIATLQTVRRLPRNRWTTTSVGQVADPLTRWTRVDGSQDCWALFRQMARRGIDRALVVKEGTLLGFVTLSDLLRLARLREELGP